MQTVLLTASFTRQANACGLEDEDVQDIAAAIAANPLAGEIIPGTGGARKLRHAIPGRGKSGGLRTIHYFGGGDVPVFLLAVYAKSQKGNIAPAEKKELSRLLPQIAETYRRKKRP